MQKFRLKVSPFINVLLALCTVIAIYIIVTTAITLSNVPSVNAIRIATLCVVIILFSFLLVVVFGALVFQYYVVKEDKLKIYLGIIVISYSLESISELIYYKDKKKLVMYYGKNKFSIVLLPEDKHEDFMKALRDKNPKIIYDNKISENDWHIRCNGVN